MASFSDYCKLYTPVLEGRVALASFVFSVISLFITMMVADFHSWTVLSVIVMCEVLYMVVLLACYRLASISEVVLYSHGIGIVFTIGTVMTLSGQSYAYFGYYTMALAFFHISEYIVTSIFNSNSLSTDSFLINHSMEYCVAAVASWIEYWVEFLLFPSLKSLHFICITGAVLVTVGELLRKVSMFTAGSNFTHIVQIRKRKSHNLVTTGVYSLFRHPSYVGWFYWSMGTQILLCNPVCLVGYIVASWMFFSDRIYHEEKSLIDFFGEEYVEYKKKVGTGLPFIKGFPLSDPRLKSLLLASQYRREMTS